MSLRVRLIVAFFLLSVVPLAAVTFYTYRTNVEIVREAAGNEAELLASELSQRMQVVTAQLSQRVERLMAMSSSDRETAPAPASTAQLREPESGRDAGVPSTAAPVPSSASASPGAGIDTGDVRTALGEFAMILNNVELRGRGRGPIAPGRGGPGMPPPGGRGTGPSGQRAGGAPGQIPGQGQRETPGPAAQGPGDGPSSLSATRPTFVPGGGPSAPGRANPTDRGGDGSRFRGAQPDSALEASGRGGFNGGAFGRGGPPAPQPEDDDPTRIRIDMGPLRQEVARQLVPDGNWAALSPEERQRVWAEVTQRMLGIEQGIQILQERVAERVADAQQQQSPGASGPPAPAAAPAAASATGDAPAADPATSTAPAAASETPAATASSPTTVSPPAESSAGATTTTSSSSANPPTEVRSPSTSSASTARTPAIARRTFTDGRLAVSVEQDGEVISQASAEINLPNLLGMVFSTTRRERGEVPFAVAKDGRLETQTPDDRAAVEAIGLEDLQPDTPPGTSVRTGWVIATTADPTGLQAKFGIARPFGEALADLRRTAALNVAFGAGLIALALIGIVPLSSRLTRNLEKLSAGVARISQGDYAARVVVTSKDEVGQLAAGFNKMAADIEVHQRSMVERERLRRELELGRQIQHDMLPQAPLRLGLSEVRGVSVPAREVGGDFFNYFQLPDGTLALIVGDVSGKGVGAALLMANLQAALRTRLAMGQDLADLARELDIDIEESTPGPVYATLFVGIFDPATRELRCVNAGHNPQYAIHRSGVLERMPATGLPIGLLAGRGYTEQRVPLESGDLLFFFTDGCVEAENAQGEMFGAERLEAALRAAVDSHDVLATVEGALSRFRAGVELSDDATMMVLRVG